MRLRLIFDIDIRLIIDCKCNYLVSLALFWYLIWKKKKNTNENILNFWDKFMNFNNYSLDYIYIYMYVYIYIYNP